MGGLESWGEGWCYSCWGWMEVGMGKERSGIDVELGKSEVVQGAEIGKYWSWPGGGARRV